MRHASLTAPVDRGSGIDGSDATKPSTDNVARTQNTVKTVIPSTTNQAKCSALTDYCCVSLNLAGLAKKRKQKTDIRA
jgi:hypothetical protein